MSTAKFDTLSNLAGTQSVPVATVAQGSAKAWVNFNGTGTVAIRASFNVSSITDNGVGDYTVNLTTAMPDADYSAVANSSADRNLAPQGVTMFYGRSGANVIVEPTTTTFRFSVMRMFDGLQVDATYAIAAVFR